MGNDFKPIRRKIGVVTLVMALVFMGGWVRSLIIGDIWHWRRSNTNVQSFISNGGRLSWEGSQQPTQIDTEYLQSIPGGSGTVTMELVQLDTFHSSQRADPTVYLNTGLPIPAEHWAYCGFEFRGYELDLGGISTSIWTIPYWSVVIPPTLISLWLLLTKPRKSTPKKTTEPIPETVA